MKTSPRQINVNSSYIANLFHDTAESLRTISVQDIDDGLRSLHPEPLSESLVEDVTRDVISRTRREAFHAQSPDASEITLSEEESRIQISVDDDHYDLSMDERASILSEGLSRIPQHHRDLLVDYYLQKLPSEDIALDRGVSLPLLRVGVIEAVRILAASLTAIKEIE